MTTQQQYLRNAASLLGMTQRELADRMAVPWSTFEKWLAPEGSKSFREMPEMAWRLVRIFIERDALADQLKVLTIPPLGGILKADPPSAKHRMNDPFAPSSRDMLISEFLHARGVYSIEDAPGDMLDAADADADKILGRGNDD